MRIQAFEILIHFDILYINDQIGRTLTIKEMHEIML